MNKKEFLEELKTKLKRVGSTDWEAVISDYEELIEDYIEDGFQFEEIVKKIGTPDDVIKNLGIKEENGIIGEQSKSGKLFITLLLILGCPLWASLLAAFFLLVLSAYIIIWCLPFILVMFAICGLAGGLASIITSFFCIQDGIHIFMLQLGIGFIFIGFGLLSTLWTISISSKFLEITKQLTERLKLIFRRKVTIYER